MQLGRRAGVHASRDTLRSTLLSPSFQSTGTVAPQKRPQISSAHQQALRPRWPRAKSAQRRATVPVAGDPQPRAPRAIAAQRRAGVHARRNNTALNTATSPFPLVWHFHTPQRPQTNPHRVLKSHFRRKKTCKNPNVFEGRFSKTAIFQHPANSMYARTDVSWARSAASSGEPVMRYVKPWTICWYIRTKVSKAAWWSFLASGN